MKESRIQYEICQYLQSQDIYFHSVPNEAPGNNKVRAMQMTATGLRAGVADLVVWVEPGAVAYMEVKTETGRQSDKQKRFQLACENHGLEYYLVRSVEDVREIVENRSHKKNRSHDNNQTTADNLRNYNAWRRGENDDMPEPKEIGETIDAAVKIITEL